jgi:Arc/MetJ-type ribon-helix-helix transcriptional regulator
MKSAVIHVRYARKDVEEIDALVDKGYYTSRSEAVKDMSRLGKTELVRQRALKAIGESFGSVKRDRSKGAAKLGRAARKSLWKDFLKKAGNDERKALSMLIKEANLETHR